jgi:hypothetical protein
MRRLLVIASLLAVSGVLASQAVAGPSKVAVSATFAEPLVPALNSGCLPSPSYGVCGSGQVIPFGQATENVVFGGACGGNCDLRTINLAAGSIYADEYFSNPTCVSQISERGTTGGAVPGTHARLAAPAAPQAWPSPRRWPRPRARRRPRCERSDTTPIDPNRSYTLTDAEPIMVK